MKGFDENNAEEMDDRADLVPLIDCVFLVLLFYVVVSTFSDEKPDPASLFKVDLPKAQQIAVRAPEDTATVTVLKDGFFGVDDQKVAPDQLLPALQARHAKRPIISLIIRGDKDAAYDKIVNVMDIAQAMKIAEFSLIVKGR